MPNLLRQVADGIAILTLHRPEKLNALDYALIDALGAALDEDEGLAVEATQFASMVPTSDIRQGIHAFLSRRKE